MLLLAEDDPPQISQNSQKLLLGMFSHRLHRCNFRECSSLCCTNQANSSPPTDFTEFTEASAGDSLPQISQIYTDGLSAEDSSGGILASAAAKCLPQIARMQFQGVHLSQVHQPSKQRFSHRLHRIHRTFCWGDLPQISQIYTDAANFRLVYFLLGWCT